jgi:Double-GTPase 1
LELEKVMEERDPRELLLVGIQETGKTSYLAAFYLTLVNSGGKLNLASFQDDREHLNKISKRLMERMVPVHTQVAEEGRLSLSLKVQATGEPVRLSIPDLSGETWEEAVEQRLWRKDIEQQVRSSDAVFLFSAADKLDAGVTKGDADYTAKELGFEPVVTEPRRSNPEAKQVRMKGKPPTQVQLVDLLQLTAEQRGKRPARACIMLSAWDTQPSELTPRRYIAENMPLLSQYLASNSDWLSARVFGVSAQGGSFKDPEARENLAKENLLERAFILDEDGSRVAMSGPIEWSLAIDGES